MTRRLTQPSSVRFIALLLLVVVPAFSAAAAETSNAVVGAFPLALENYGDADYSSVWAILRHRVEQEPFNLWATLLFLAAVVHTFFTHKFRHWAHVLKDRHNAKFQQQRLATAPSGEELPPIPPCIPARVLHFLGEVEAVFGIWVVPLFLLMMLRVGRPQTIEYINNRVSYQEPLFVVVIMAIASTRPILRLAEQCLRIVAGLGKERPVAWWLAILTLGPLLGSLITEPAAMTIAASLLARQFYSLKPRLSFAHATLGLLFVNVSVGGVLTHFAAPPVLMVAGAWHWNTPFMAAHFGWVAVVGILISNGLYLLVFHKDFRQLAANAAAVGRLEPGSHRCKPVPVWVTLGHLGFMGWSVLHAHHAAYLIGGFLFFLAFYDVTQDYQSELQLRAPILVGFFLAGLVIHGGLQQWWIAPVLGRLSETPLMLGAIGLTAFNDNAAITYLSTLVPGLTAGMKYAVVAGAVTGGGLTVIANAPNPAGQAILGRFFPDGISPLGLFLGALPPTIILAACFFLLA